MSEPLCPLGDGRHKRVPWAGEGRSGLVCVKCSKTWEFVGKSLIATYDLLANPRLRSEGGDP